MLFTSEAPAKSSCNARIPQLFALLGQQLSPTLVQVAVKKDDRASFNFFRFQV